MRRSVNYRLMTADMIGKDKNSNDELLSILFPMRKICTGSRCKVCG